MSTKDRPVFYEPHPVTAERKAELRAAGVQIVDSVFKPADYENPALPAAATSGTEQVRSEGSKPSEGLKVDEIKAALAAKGITIPEGVALKADLAALLDAAPAE